MGAELVSINTWVPPIFFEKDDTRFGNPVSG